MGESFGQLIDLSQFKKKESPKANQPVEVKTISEEQAQANPTFKRANELQKEDQEILEPCVKLMMSLVYLVLNPSVLQKFTTDIYDVDAEGNPILNDRQKFLKDITDSINKIIDDGGAKRDIKYGFMALGQCMNLLTKVFYNDHNEYIKDLHDIYQMTIKEAIIPILNNNHGLTSRQFYMMPGSIIDYSAWNSNLERASAELFPQESPPIEAITPLNEVTE